MRLAGWVAVGAVALCVAVPKAVVADTYVIDTEGSHASINFKIRHLGFSWLTGRFDKFSGTFDYDPENPGASKISVDIDTASVNSNHAKRDKHLRDPDFLDVANHPKASFVSTGVKVTGEGTADVTGNLTLHGVTKEVVIKATHIGGGDDPWGGYRHGFSGTTSLKLKDFGIDFNLGPSAESVDLELHVEGVKQE